MTDPILGLTELLEGDSKGYLRQNDRNLIVAALLMGTVQSNALSAPPGTETRGQVYVVSGTASGLWTGQAANTVAIALADTPTSALGWFYLAPPTGMRLWVLAGSPTGHVVWNGSSFAAV